ncbi:Rha family transcriptional regulator [Marinobacter sp.]|uniref:Rha family transcriptional regulator n=1 Tax=Marinobacter sp. TaxID=50741 RepID=UPI003A951DC9
MNQLAPAFNAPQPTMTSKEIADLVEARHNDVVATIQRLFEKGLLRSDRKTSRVTTGGRPIAVYRLTERDTHLVVAGYSDEHRARVIDRWQELENRQAPALPQTLPEALRLAADMAERNAQLEAVASEQAETIESLQNLFVEGMTPAQFVKGLNGVNCMAINQLLAERNWLFREGGHWRVGSYARDKYLTEQQTQITPRNAEPFVQFKPILLRKGAAAIYKLYLKRELVMKSTWNGEFTHDTIQKVA